MIRESENERKRKKRKRGIHFMCHIDVTTESECILQTLDFVLRTV